MANHYKKLVLKIYNYYVIKLEYTKRGPLLYIITKSKHNMTKYNSNS